MNAISNLRIGSRLGLMLACVLALMCGVAGAGLWGLDSLFRITTHALAQDVALAQRAGDIRTLVLLERRFEKDAFINLADAAKLAGYVKKWQDVRAKLGQTIDETAKLELNAEDSAAMRDIGSHFKVYAGGFESTLAAMAAGQITSTQDANADLGKVKAAVHGMESTSDAMSERATTRAKGVLAQIDAVRARASLL